MEEPQRTKILESYQILCAQIDTVIERARADFASGQPLEDLLAGGGADFAKNASVESLAFAVTCMILREAKKPVRKTRKTAVPAKRPRSARKVPDAVE